MVEVDVLKDDETDKEYILIEGSFLKLSKEELINKVIQLSEGKELKKFYFKYFS